MVAPVTHTLARLDTWLAEARAVLDGLTPDDPRRARAERLIRERQAERDRSAADEQRLEQRYPWHVRWGRERGVLEVRDVFDGSWIGVDAREAPDGWRREAQQRALAARSRQGDAPPPPRTRP